MSTASVAGTGLRGLTALVTGGSRGIGRGIAGAFASHGANVIITSRDEQAAIGAAMLLGSGVAGLQCDVTSTASIVDCVARTKVRQHATAPST
jgi:NAD(P)-dependent dehydrogenase (short-subunit alcohol dehydrogenase family)